MRMLQWPELIGDGVCDARTRQKSRGVQLHIGRRACAEGIHTIWCPTIATGSYTSDACFLAGSRRATVDSAPGPVSYTHLRAHETRHDLVCRLLLEKKKK